MKQSNANSIIKRTQEIASFVQKHKLTPFEQKNILRDLEVIHKRIASRQYAETDFLKRNRFDAGRRTEEFFHYMEGYIKQSKHWEQILKPIIDHNQIRSITDLCPGWAPKIEIALGHLSYKGTVYLFDSNIISMEKLSLFAHHFYPSLQLHAYKGNFFSKTIKPQSDLTVGNHIIDDLLLSLYAKKTHMTINTLYTSEDLFIQATHDISKDSMLIRKATEKITTSLLRFIKPNSIFLLSQYPGLTESSLDLSSWIQCVSKITTNIMSILQQQGIHIQTLQ